MASPTGQRGVSPFFCRRNHRPVFSADHIIIRRTGAVNAFFRFFNLLPEDLLFFRKYSLYLSESPLAISIFHPQRPPRRRGRSPQTPADEKNLFFFVPGREQWALARHICYRNGKLPAHKPLVFGRKLCYLEDTQRRQQTPAAPRRAPPPSRGRKARRTEPVFGPFPCLPRFHFSLCVRRTQPCKRSSACSAAVWRTMT